MGRFETEFLTQEDNRQALARMNTRWVERAMAHTLHQRVILDMDMVGRLPVAVALESLESSGGGALF